jgi:hypothetical protein
MAPDWPDAGLIPYKIVRDATLICPIFGQFDSLQVAVILGIFA